MSEDFGTSPSGFAAGASVDARRVVSRVRWGARSRTCPFAGVVLWTDRTSLHLPGRRLPDDCTRDLLRLQTSTSRNGTQTIHAQVVHGAAGLPRARFILDGINNPGGGVWASQPVAAV